MSKLNALRETWAGRKFRCKKTGEELVIPDDVYFRKFYEFGNCFIDVGDGFYARFGGDIEEIEKK